MFENTFLPPSTGPKARPRHRSPLASPEISYAAVAGGRASPSRHLTSGLQVSPAPPRSPPRTRFLGMVSADRNEFYDLMYAASASPGVAAQGGQQAPLRHDTPDWEICSPPPTSTLLSVLSAPRTAQASTPSGAPPPPSQSVRQRPRPRMRPVPSDSGAETDDDRFILRPVNNPQREQVDLMTSSQASVAPIVQPATANAQSVNSSQASHSYIFIHSQTPALPSQPMQPALQAESKSLPKPCVFSPDVMELTSTNDELTGDEQEATPRRAAVPPPAAAPAAPVASNSVAPAPVAPAAAAPVAPALTAPAAPALTAPAAVPSTTKAKPRAKVSTAANVVEATAGSAKRKGKSGKGKAKAIESEDPQGRRNSGNSHGRTIRRSFAWTRGQGAATGRS
ncbi:hypothetical protein FRC08_015727 [Ceratobasidium sp. 394]|nr:hypothetical protein FRC08_015727 [Ceratobasidium sp. 394]